MNKRLKEGRTVNDLHLRSVRSMPICIPDPQRLVHLQFRRFAGCPVCDLHLHSMARRYEELAAASIEEVVVFHSSREELLPFYEELPFEIVPDPDKRLYAQFGVEYGLRALLSPRVWGPIIRGVLQSLWRTLCGRAPLAPLFPRGGRLGLPADFLIAPSGVIVACKYGSHAYDQWSVDEVLLIAASARFSAEVAVREGIVAADSAGSGI